MAEPKPQKLKYPEAEERARHFEKLVKELTMCRNIIDSQFGGLNRVSLSNQAVSSDLNGDYYSTYVTQKDKWFDEVRQIEKSFSTFLSNLDVCISNANSRFTLWRSRIGVEI